MTDDATQRAHDNHYICCQRGGECFSTRAAIDAAVKAAYEKGRGTRITAEEIKLLEGGLFEGKWVRAEDHRLAVKLAVKAAEERGKQIALETLARMSGDSDGPEIRESLRLMIGAHENKAAAEMRERAALIAAEGDMTAFIVAAIRALPLHKEPDDTDTRRTTNE